MSRCLGWIDGIRKSLDEASFLQRYTPPSAQHVEPGQSRPCARLTAAERMMRQGSARSRRRRQTDAGTRLCPIRAASAATIPEDLRAAIDANPRARKTFASLGRMNLFALTFRTNNMKTPAGVEEIAALVDMLARGETIVRNREEQQVGKDLTVVVDGAGRDRPSQARHTSSEMRKGSPDQAAFRGLVAGQDLNLRPFGL